ncbi:hypothetical protein ACFL43_05250 [Thermodesulfobacteriota bacterium]
MKNGLRITAYCFLALVGMSAWNTYAAGWKCYAGMILFVVCTFRIFKLLRRQLPDAGKNTQGQVAPERDADGDGQR